MESGHDLCYIGKWRDRKFLLEICTTFQTDRKVERDRIDMNGIEESLDLQNRRAARRFAIELPVTSSGNAGRTLNISATGMRFISRATKTTSDQLDLVVDLGAEKIQLSGETVWSQQLGNSRVVGAHFKPSKDLHKLCRFLYPV